MKTFLLPLNLGPNTLPLFEFAKKVAMEAHASLLLLHVVHKQSYDNGTFSKGTKIHESVAHESQFILDQLSRDALSEGICTRVLILDGEPLTTISDTAEKYHVDSIILKISNDHHEISDQLLTEAPCPILTFHEGRDSAAKIKADPEAAVLV
jgi:hypothetical protein